MTIKIIKQRQRINPGYVEPAIARCYCGAEVTLDDALENKCSCGRAFNMSGQEVQPNYGRAECAADGWAYDESDY